MSLKNNNNIWHNQLISLLGHKVYGLHELILEITRTNQTARKAIREEENLITTLICITALMLQGANKS